MKKNLMSLCFLLMCITINAQDIVGQWNGELKIQGTQLRLVFNVTKTNNLYTSTMDSPDQGAKGIPVTSTTFNNLMAKFEITNLKFEYSGVLKDNQIIGSLKQNGMEFAMNLSRNVIEKEVPKRPQEPKQPFSYYSEEVKFQNTTSNQAIAGTLSLPQMKGKFPVVVLISGSGPQNRDGELLGHKPFLLLADYLTKNGIAVLRCDDRGVGKSTGNFSTATSADFATDIESTLTYLKTRSEINSKKIGLIGHSEGGIIAPMVASKSKDVAFIVLLAAPAISGDQLLLLQQELIARASGVSEIEIEKSRQIFTTIFNFVNQSNDTEKLKSEIADVFKNAMEVSNQTNFTSEQEKTDYVDSQVNQIVNPWMQYFIKYNPSKALEQLQCPVLALNGERDLQVSPKENLLALKNALTKGKNKRFEVKEFAGLNHLFQESKTGLPAEYAIIEQTFSPLALKEISDWIKTIGN